MSTLLIQEIERKGQVRRGWQVASFDAKIAALVRMQRMAQEMAHAAGRPFEGTVWQGTEAHEARR